MASLSCFLFFPFGKKHGRPKNPSSSLQREAWEQMGIFCSLDWKMLFPHPRLLRSLWVNLQLTISKVVALIGWSFGPNNKKSPKRIKGVHCLVHLSDKMASKSQVFIVSFDQWIDSSFKHSLNLTRLVWSPLFKWMNAKSKCFRQTYRPVCNMYVTQSGADMIVFLWSPG